MQSFHRLEIYYKLEVFLLKLMKIESDFEMPKTTFKGLEKNLNFIISVALNHFNGDPGIFLFVLFCFQGPKFGPILNGISVTFFPILKKSQS